MNIGLLFAQWQAKGLGWWHSLSPDTVYYVWAGSGGLLFLILVWFSHLVIRKALGHRKFRGSWFNEDQFEALLKIIEEDCARGNRVMKNDEMQLLRRWRFGSGKSISDRAKGYL